MARTKNGRRLCTGRDCHRIYRGATTPDHSRVLIGPGTDVFTGLQQSNLEDQHTTDEYHLVWNYNIDPSWTLWAWQVTW